MTIRAVRFCLLVAIVPLAACSSNKDRSIPPGTYTAGVAARYLASDIRSRSESAASIVWYRSADELLPNVVYREPDGTDRRSTGFAVLGRVKTVEKGVGMSWSYDEGDESRRILEFDDKSAEAATLHLVFTVDESIPRGAAPDEIRVGVVTEPGADLERLAAGWTELGTMVLFIADDEPGPVFDYDRDLLSVHDTTRMVATVDKDGKLAMPFYNEREGEELLQGVNTLERLRAKAESPERVIQLRASEPESQVLVRDE